MSANQFRTVLACLLACGLVGAAVTVTPVKPEWIVLHSSYGVGGDSILIKTSDITPIYQEPYTSPSTGQTQYHAVVVSGGNHERVAETVDTVKAMIDGRLPSGLNENGSLKK